VLSAQTYNVYKVPIYIYNRTHRSPAPEMIGFSSTLIAMVVLHLYPLCISPHACIRNILYYTYYTCTRVFNNTVMSMCPSSSILRARYNECVSKKRNTPRTLEPTRSTDQSPRYIIRVYRQCIIDDIHII